MSVSKRVPSQSASTTGQAPKLLRTSTVLFTEWSREGTLQKSLREVCERLAPLIGFRVRVTERGGTELSSLLSNKNLWSGQGCGRQKCFPCKQEGERKQECKVRNIVYESECSLCTGEKNEKSTGTEASLRKEGEPHMYVGESSRSLQERAGDHFSDARRGVKKGHMLDHMDRVHKEKITMPPPFSFKVVKSCQSALERQVREAVRIERRGAVLNKRGEFNRCKLTRLGVDRDWERQVWEESWVVREETTVQEEEAFESKNKNKCDNTSFETKKRKVEGSNGVVWGEGLS